mmetsp:Transcript_17745/g.28730  ORF Transcript_17745/g.28730 Transcript_17745/m.28730 type:complete len:151 (+) Transcript_17745:33-485(+)
MCDKFGEALTVQDECRFTKALELGCLGGRRHRKRVKTPSKPDQEFLSLDVADDKVLSHNGGLVVGMNAVSRSVKKKRLRFVVICGKGVSRDLQKVMGQLCKANHVPFAVLVETTSYKLGLAVGLRSACVIGFETKLRPEFDPCLDELPLG